MIRLRPLRPREQRNLRHWAMELVVVVAGVLLALWAAEWAARRSQAIEDARVIRDVADEAATNMLALAFFRGSDRCSTERVAELRDRIEQSGKDWPGEREYPNSLAAGAIYPMMVRMRGAFPTRDQFERAILSGALERHPENARLRELYYVFGNFTRARERFTAIQPKIAVLSRPTQMTDQRRWQMLEHLAEIDAALLAMRQSSSAAYDNFPEAIAHDLAERQATLDGYERLAIKERGDCVVAIDLSTGEPRT